MTLDARERGLSAAIAARETRLYADLERWVAIPTGGRHRAGLDELRGVLCERLAALGAAVELLPGDPRPAWLALPDDPPVDSDEAPPTATASRAAANGPRVLLAGHIDTVHDPRGAFRRLVRESDRVCRGPGAVDMKGGLVIAVHALEALSEAGIDVAWTFLLNSDEETGSFHSARHLEEAARCHDVGIALEPATEEGGLVIERMGTGQFRIDAEGRSAHVGRDYARGVSAVRALAKAILDAESVSDAAAGRIVNVGPLIGGRVTNAVPDRASCWGNVRFRDATAQRDLERHVRGIGSEGTSLPRLTVMTAFNRPSKPCTPAVERMAIEIRAVSEALGRPLPFASTGGVCDGNILQAAGLPTIDTLGVRGGNLHRTDEWVEIPSLVDRCQLLAIVLSRSARLVPSGAASSGHGQVTPK